MYGHWQTAKLEKERTELAAEAQRMVRSVEAKKQAAARSVEGAYVAKLKQVSSTVVSLRSANDKLQLAIENGSSTSGDATALCGVDGERTRALESLLVEGAALAREGAEEVARLGAKTDALQEYVRLVCVSK